MEPTASPLLPTLLIVDDDTLLTSLFRQAMTKKGFQIVEAHSGKQALAMVAQQTIDLIVLDMSLPDMEGIAVARALARTDPTLPIIIATGHDPETDDLPANVAEVVRKPFSFRTLAESIKTLLSS